MNPTDCDAAVANFDEHGSSIPVDPNRGIVSIRGSVVAFFCNYANHATKSSPNWLFDADLRLITKSCGHYVAGSFGIEMSFANGYMIHYEGLDVSANALTSPVDSCSVPSYIILKPAPPLPSTN